MTVALAALGIETVRYIGYDIFVHRDDYYVVAPNGDEYGTCSMARARLWVRRHRRAHAL